MSSQGSFWQRMGLHDWFLKKEATVTVVEPTALTPDDVFKYIVEKFEESIAQLSFGNRIVFFHEYIICFNPEDYNQFMNNKKGIFGIIIHESVKRFYEILNEYRQRGKTVEPASNKWVFRFVSHPEYARGDKSYIGKLLPGTPQPKEENLRVTFIPRQTGIAEALDVNPELMEGFTYYSEGYYEVEYKDDLKLDDEEITSGEKSLLARFETVVPDKEYIGKKIEYLMRAEQILITGKDDMEEAEDKFRIPSEWVSSPHLSVRFNKADGKFYLASYGEKTMLNEREVRPSAPDSPSWVELPVNSKIVLNGIVGVNIFKS
ncbi:hypothetical protein [Aridibaculum aurantiacum]|uniref:hypothetical protein n=1 Tax=Aridibaculum aurantiacum TaxID=2810307 RepID=UPI001A969E19|nr:hypothetical protein [Aridibaculum aurantiacum]